VGGVVGGGVGGWFVACVVCMCVCDMYMCVPERMRVCVRVYQTMECVCVCTHMMVCVM